MVQGLIIKQDGFLQIINYEKLKNFKDFIIDFKDYDLLEIHELGKNEEYRIYGKTLGYNFNKFEFQSCNPIGDVVVVKTNMFGKVKDLDIQEFLDYYQEEDDLDDYLIEDEMFSQDEEYEYNDFCIEDEDLKSYMEYKNEHD